MWEHLLRTDDMFTPYQYLGFGPLLSFSSDRGIDDSAWTASEDPDAGPVLSAEAFELL